MPPELCVGLEHAAAPDDDGAGDDGVDDGDGGGRW